MSILKRTKCKAIVSIMLLLAVSMTLMTTGGCATEGQTGALTGAAVGALAGQAIGGDTKGTLTGAAIGAGAGYIIGKQQE
jgi:hypothetical protein